MNSGRMNTGRMNCASKHPNGRARLFQRIDSEPTQQLRIKIGGLLRKNVARESDVTDMLRSRGIHEEGYISLTAADHVDCILGVANVGHVLLVTNCFL